MNKVAKGKLALYWAASCGGCEISVLAIDDKILKVAEAFDIVFWPVAVDAKVRDVEKMVQSLGVGGMKRSRRRDEATTQLQQVADQLKQVLGTKVQIESKGNGGKLTIEYYSAEDLNRIIGLIL